MISPKDIQYLLVRVRYDAAELKETHAGCAASALHHKSSVVRQSKRTVICLWYVTLLSTLTWDLWCCKSVENLLHEGHICTAESHVRAPSLFKQ